MARVLVTGGGGFIGSHLVDRLVDEGHTVRVLDNFVTGRRSNLERSGDRIELLEADLRELDVCQQACTGVEVVFHEAALPSVPLSVEKPGPSHDTNVTGTFNLLRAAVDQKVRRVIYAGSSSAYGDSEVSPKHEGLLPAPLSPYAVQKLTGEHYLRAFHACYGLETVTLRYFNVFGARQDPASQYAAAIPAFVTKLLAGEPPTVYGDGEQTRDFTHIANVVHGNLLAMSATGVAGQTLNLACGAKISVNAVIAKLNELLGTQVHPIYAPPRAGDVRHSCADITLARKLLNFEPVVDLEAGLRQAIDYYRSLA